MNLKLEDAIATSKEDRKSGRYAIASDRGAAKYKRAWTRWEKRRKVAGEYWNPQSDLRYRLLCQDANCDLQRR